MQMNLNSLSLGRMEPQQPRLKQQRFFHLQMGMSSGITPPCHPMTIRVHLGVTLHLPT